MIFYLAVKWKCSDQEIVFSENTKLSFILVWDNSYANPLLFTSNQREFESNEFETK